MQQTIKNLDWLKINAKFLSIRAIEVAIGCPTDTIQKFVGSANRPIPKKWQLPIAEFVNNLKQ